MKSRLLGILGLVELNCTGQMAGSGPWRSRKTCRWWLCLVVYFLSKYKQQRCEEESCYEQHLSWYNQSLDILVNSFQLGSLQLKVYCLLQTALYSWEYQSAMKAWKQWFSWAVQRKRKLNVFSYKRETMSFTIRSIEFIERLWYKARSLC